MPKIMNKYIDKFGKIMYKENSFDFNNNKTEGIGINVYSQSEVAEIRSYEFNIQQELLRKSSAHFTKTFNRLRKALKENLKKQCSAEGVKDNVYIFEEDRLNSIIDKTIDELEGKK